MGYISPWGCKESDTTEQLHFLFSVTYDGCSWWLSGKESTYQCRRHGFDPWVGKIPWRRKWQPTPVLSPGESHGRRSLVGYISPWGCKEWDMTERLHFHFQTGFQIRWWRFSCSVVSNSCNSMDCSLPGSSVHEILQTRILEWAVISFSRGYFQSRNLTPVSCIASGFFTNWAISKALRQGIKR